MWIIAPGLVISVVDKGKDHSKLCIRARSSEDLDFLREGVLPTLGKTIENAGSDYPYRAWADREVMALAMAELVRGIQYPNMKNEVRRVQGAKREGVLHKVWAALLELEPPRKKWTPNFNSLLSEDWEEVTEEQQTTMCRVCHEEVAVIQTISPELKDEELLTETQRQADLIAKECDFTATGSHWGSLDLR